MSIKMTDESPTTEIPVRRMPTRTEQTYRSSSSPGRSRLRAFLRGLRTALVVLVLLAAAALGGAYLTRDRLAGRAFVELGSAILTAEPVPVGTTAAGSVSEVEVAPQSEVSAGEALARVTITGPDGEPATEVLRSPIDGIVSEVNVPSGGVATAGTPVLTLYDPARLTFQANASVEELRKLRIGMAARFAAKGLGQPISARLDRVVPRVGTRQGASAGSGSGGFTVVFVPDTTARSDVRGLVPGLPFTVTVDTRTAADGPPAVRGAP